MHLPFPLPSLRDALIDYRLFKAARVMQRYIRGWLCRRRFLRQKAAVITISRWWRGYNDRKTHFVVVSEHLQATLVAYYDRQATKVQAMYRGWRNRLYVHDVRGLSQMQLNAAQDVINCVAYKLHTLLREGKLPGVYSLRATDCQDKVEELLSSLVLRFLNGRLHGKNAERRDYLLRARKDFRNSVYQTYAPFCGPCGLCDCIDDNVLQANKEMDVYMARVVALYEEARRDLRIQKNRRAASLQRNLEHGRTMHRRRQERFCNDIFKRILCLEISIEFFAEDKWKMNSRNFNNFLDVLDELKKVNSTTFCCKPQLVEHNLCN